jgi:hypothetical protein
MQEWQIECGRTIRNREDGKDKKGKNQFPKVIQKSRRMRKRKNQMPL